MAGPVEDRERAVRELRESCSGFPGAYGVIASMDHEHRAIDAGQELPHTLLVREPQRELGRD
jgi:hypothetical protein